MGKLLGSRKYGVMLTTLTDHGCVILKFQPVLLILEIMLSSLLFMARMQLTLLLSGEDVKIVTISLVLVELKVLISVLVLFLMQPGDGTATTTLIKKQTFFEELYQHFRVQPCYTGVTPECNATLQAFACHESFRRCDAEGFYTGTCRDSCEAVVYECANWFETVDLEHYNCTSSRYLDGNAQTCTGSPAFAHIDPATQHFLGNDPNLLLFKSSPSSSPASALSVSFVVSLLFTFFALMF